MIKKVVSPLFYLFVSFSLSCLVSTYSFGQSYNTFNNELDQILKKARWAVGPFRINPRIFLKNVGFDNNVFYRREGEGKIVDLTGTISGEFNVYLLFRNYLILSLAENPEYVFYNQQKRERRFHNTISPAFKLLFLHRFVISGSYSRQRMRWRASSEFNTQANETQEGYKASLFFEGGQNDSIGISFSSEKTSFQNIYTSEEDVDIYQDLGRKERIVNFEFYRRILSDSFFFIRGGNSSYKFNFLQSGWRDSSSYQVYSGIQFPELGRIRGMLSLGFKLFKPDKREKKSYSGLVGNTKIEYRAGRLNFLIEYRRDVFISYWTNNVFFIENKYAGGASFYLTNFLRVDYNLSRGIGNYPELLPFPMPDGSYELIKRKDKYEEHTLGLVFRIIRRTGIGLSINYWKRNSNYFGEDRDRVFFGAYMTADF